MQFKKKKCKKNKDGVADVSITSDDAMPSVQSCDELTEDGGSIADRLDNLDGSVNCDLVPIEIGKYKSLFIIYFVRTNFGKLLEDYLR